MINHIVACLSCDIVQELGQYFANSFTQSLTGGGALQSLVTGTMSTSSTFYMTIYTAAVPAGVALAGAAAAGGQQHQRCGSGQTAPQVEACISRTSHVVLLLVGFAL